MTISVSGLTAFQTQQLYAPSIYGGSNPFTNLAVTDDLTSNVTLTVTQTSYLHTDPGQADDQKIRLGAGTYTPNYSTQSNNPSNPPSFDPTTGTLVVSGSLTSLGYYNGFAKAEYSPLYQLRNLIYTSPVGATLSGKQVIETNFVVTATDAAGSAPVTSSAQVLYTNPISLIVNSIQSSYGSANTEPVGSTMPNPQLFVSNANYGADYTLTVTQSTTLHSNLGGLNDQVTPVGLGTWGAFKPTTGDALNPPVIDPTTGTFTATSATSPTGGGTLNPLTGKYSPTTYTPTAEYASSPFTPAAVPLTGTASFQTVFTYTATDTHGDTATGTSTVTFTNPTSFILRGVVPSTSPSDLKQSIVPFSVQQITNSTLNATAMVTQQNLIHTHIGASDDTTIAVGVGALSYTQAGYGGDGPPTNTPVVDASTGTVTVQGPLSYPFINSAPHAYNPVSELNSLRYSAPFVSLSAGQVLETKFVVTIQDERGDISTQTASAYFKSTAVAATGGSGSTGGSGTTPTGGGNTGTTPVGGGSASGNGGVVGGTGSGSLPAGSTAPINQTTVAPVFRFFDKDDGTHFFTSDTNERNTILATRSDLVQETNGFGAVTASSSNAVAVYRFFDSIHGTHFFTSDANEKASVQASRSDLIFESSATFYEKSVGNGGDNAVYRFFDTKLGTHFYTGDAKEYAGITTPGTSSYRTDLVAEGISFYAPSGSYT